MPDWQTLSSKTVYETPWLRVREDRVLNHAGKELTYGLAESKNPFAYIVAVNTANEILLFRNYRYSLGKMVWEFPAGFSDGQDLLVAAKRELLEETGYESNDWTLLGNQYAATGLSHIPFSVFLARNIQVTQAAPERDEQITSHRFFSLTAVNNMILAGDVPEACAPAALYLARLHGFPAEGN